MKKITSIFSLALFAALTLSLSSCSDCDGGEGSGSGITPETQKELNSLTQQLAEQAQKLAALPTNGTWVLSCDENGNWYYTNPTTGQVIPLDPTKSAYKIGDNGNWFINGVDTGISAIGKNGIDGKSAYEVAVAGGYVGTEEEWLASLKGKDGVDGTNGVDGKSAYEIAVAGGYVGTEAEWLASLKGKDGKDGVDGKDGKDGVDGKDGKDGKDGVDGKDGKDGVDGKDGKDGKDGTSGIMDDLGVYVTYKDKDGNEQKEYFPQFTADDENNVTTITVGGTTYKIPKACKCSITKNADGSYTVKAGETEETITVPTVPSWVDTYSVSYEGGQFVIKNNDGQSVRVPKGSAEVSVDPTSGVATITSTDGTTSTSTSVKLQKTQPVVYTDGKGHVAIQNYDLNGNPVGDAYTLPTYGEFAALTKKVDDIDTDLTNVKNQIGTWDPTTQGKTITEAIEGITSDINTLESNISSMFEKLLKAIAESITNIQVEEVVSNAIGSYNGIFTNLKTTKLVGYIGTFQKMERFPSDVADYIKIPAGTVYTDTLGEIQLTVNPISKDFSNLSVSLVNSLGEESSIKLSNLKGSDKLLKTGFTRADGTGLYTTSAIVDKVDIVSDPKLHMTIDKSAVKTAISDLINDMKKSDWKNANVNVQPSTLNKILNAINSAVEGVSTERLAVKTEWEQTVTDPVTGKDVTTKKSVVSPYDLSGIAFKPLSFEAYPKDTLVEKFQRLDNRAKNFIKRMNDKLANRVKKTIDEKFGLDKIESQIGELQIKLDKIEPIDKTLTTDITMHLKIQTNVPIKFTQNMQVGYEILVPTDLFNTTGWEDDIKGQGAELDREKSKVLSSDPTYTMAYIKQNVSFDVDENPEVNIDQDVTAKDVTIDVSDLVEPVNNAVDAIKSINALCESVNNIIDQVRNIENKIEKGTYLNRIYKYLDKASAYAAKGIYKLFQPVLLVNSDKGFSFAGIRGVAAKASGKVEVIPTTFSNGLVAPIYKKYISVNGGKGKVLDGSQISLDITSELKKGYNKVEFYAIDYHGIEKHYTYSIFKE